MKLFSFAKRGLALRSQVRMASFGGGGGDLPYGSWPSPFTAKFITSSSVGLSNVKCDGDGGLWWQESKSPLPPGRQPGELQGWAPLAGTRRTRLMQEPRRFHFSVGCMHISCHSCSFFRFGLLAGLNIVLFLNQF